MGSVFIGNWKWDLISVGFGSFHHIWDEIWLALYLVDFFSDPIWDDIWLALCLVDSIQIIFEMRCN